MKPINHIKSAIKGIARTVTAVVAVCAFGTAVHGQVNTQQTVNIGRNAMYFEDYVLAIQYFNRAIQAKPYQAWPYFYRSIAKINLEDYEGAAADAAKALELNPFITDAYEVHGVALQNMGDSRAAIDDYRKALSQLPNNRQITFNMAMAMTEVEDYDAADSVYTRLLDRNPGFENGYLGRARLALLRKDTANADAYVRKALKINPSSFNGHVMLADMNMHRGKEHFDTVIVHLDHAIRLQPLTAGLYVNRAYVRYTLNDFYGAMADFDHAIELEPNNKQALFNRGLLAMEVNDYDRALRDFTQLLDQDPTDVRSRYNRTVIYMNRNEFKKALKDVEFVIDAFPNFPTGYMMRSSIYRGMGNLAAAATDSDRGKAISARLKPDKKGRVEGKQKGVPDESEMTDEDIVKREFASLLTSDDNTDMRQEFNNSEIRGRIQDRNLTIDTEPMIELTYYSSPTDLKPDTYYIKEVNDLNETRALRNKVLVSANVPTLTDEDIIGRHFRNIEYYNSYISTHTPRAIDYFGRAMDLVTVRDYENAIRDLDRTIALTPDYAPAYMLRAQARARALEGHPVSSMTPEDGKTIPISTAASRDALRHHTIDLIIEDLDRVIALSPQNPYALYNKGNMLVRQSNLNQAMEAYSAAIAIKEDFGEAWFNRGYVQLRQGNRVGGISDLSKAGELGIAAAYNLIKRIGRRD